MVCYDGFNSWKSKFNKSGEDTVTDISEETSHMCLFTSERESPQTKVLVFIKLILFSLLTGTWVKGC